MSTYGPKKAGLYNPADNARRKKSRTGEVMPGWGADQNKEVRAYSTKPGQLSAKESANAEQKKVKKLSGPVKTFSEAEKEALATKMGLKKSEKCTIAPNGQWSLKDEE